MRVQGKIGKIKKTNKKTGYEQEQFYTYIPKTIGDKISTGEVEFDYNEKTKVIKIYCK